MKVLVVGSGGREHAIVWKIAQSHKVSKIYCAPGNGGISELAECVNIKATDMDGMVDFATQNKIDLTVVAPDDPLAMGMVDALEKKGLRAFGPNQAAAEIEASKSFSKDLMKKYHIPTADYHVYSSFDEAKAHLVSCSYPIVVKANGLALGKGVIIAKTMEEAIEATQKILVYKDFGSAGDRVVIEEFITGPEVSVLTFTDGKTIVPMVSSQDHKRAFDNDEGPNTGGMGTFSPSLQYTLAMQDEVMETILKPTIEGMKKEGRPFKGVLYVGLMLTPQGIRVLEYNARFGDPETQVVLPRLKTDLIDIFDAIIDEKLDSINFEWEDNATVCVALASGGYPSKYETGIPMFGLSEAAKMPDVVLFHAGTKKENGQFVTAGGRVLGVTASGTDIPQAREKAYAAVKKISFEGMHYRTDIGIK